MGLVDEPLYLLLSLTDSGIFGAHPGTVCGLMTHMDFLPRDRRIEWTVNCKIGNLIGPAAASLENGGHVAVGLGDYSYSELGTPTNGEVIHSFAQLARAMGREASTPVEAREMLGMG